MRRFGLLSLLLALLAFLPLSFAQGGLTEAERKEFFERYVRYLTPAEAKRWVETQGVSFLYVGEKELCPGLGESLRGKQVKVYAGTRTQSLPWLDRAGVRYALFRMPGELLAQDAVLIAKEAYILGAERDSKGKPTGRYVLVTYKEAANVLYRIFEAYEAFAKEVKR